MFPVPVRDSPALEPRSENQLGAKLHRPGAARSCDQSEIRTRDVRVRVIPLGRIKRLERLAPELELETLPDCKVAEDRRVHVPEAGAADHVLRKVAELRQPAVLRPGLRETVRDFSRGESE